jgi:hypothetical protein
MWSCALSREQNKVLKYSAGGGGGSKPMNPSGFEFEHIREQNATISLAQMKIQLPIDCNILRT